MSDELYPREEQQETREDELYGTTSASGAPKLAGIFFGAAVLCAVFFAVGYKMGKNAEPAPPSATASAVTNPINTTKPSAAVHTAPMSVPAPAIEPGTAKPSSAAAKTPARSTPEMSRTSGGTFAVQVAAVSRQEDADALEGALRSKSYPVFIVNQPGDKLFHVQVGPFSSLADAEAMKAKLAGDGYNPILKK